MSELFDNKVPELHNTSGSRGILKQECVLCSELAHAVIFWLRQVCIVVWYMCTCSVYVVHNEYGIAVCNVYIYGVFF